MPGLTSIAAVLDAELITDVARLRELTPEWDRLALAARNPLSSPAWMLAWLDHMAPAGSSPRVIVVRDRGELVGLAPFYVQQTPRKRVDYRLVGDVFPRAMPLAVAAREREVAQAVAGALAAASPQPDVVALESSGPPSQWGSLLREGWPGHVAPLMFAYLTMPSPVISLEADSFEAWLGAKSSNFRSQMRRMRRQFEQQGGVARTSTEQTLARDVELFKTLHAGRWQGRGESTIVSHGERFDAMVASIDTEHIESRRLRLWILEVQGTPISAQLFAAGGGEVVYYNGGWDESFAKLKPAMLGILYAIEQGFAQGDERIDLGPGAQPYKLRFADRDDPLTWTILLAPGRRMPLTLVRSAPMLTRELARAAAKRRLSGEQLERVRSAKRKLASIRER